MNAFVSVINYIINRKHKFEEKTKGSLLAAISFNRLSFLM